MYNELVSDINYSFAISLPDTISLDELKQKLSVRINHLINHDFEKLVFHLYRIDVNEDKLRDLLAQKENEHTAGLIAGLIIERQIQKIESRKKSGGAENIPDDEKW